MKVKDCFLGIGRFQLNNGCNIQFWEDKWLEDYTLKQQFSLLYSITRRKNIFVAAVFSRVPLNIFFYRGLVGN
jgi:hypothetical protein